MKSSYKPQLAMKLTKRIKKELVCKRQVSGSEHNADWPAAVSQHQGSCRQTSCQAALLTQVLLLTVTDLVITSTGMHCFWLAEKIFCTCVQHICTAV